MLEINFNPFPILATERLTLRHIDNEDFDAIFDLRSNPETMRFIPRDLQKTTQNALEHIAQIEETIQKNEGINWGITFKNNPKMIGIIGFYRIKPENHRSELGYMLLPEFQGTGIITEAIKGVLQYGFNVLHFNSIEAIIDPRNVASECVLQKNGFVKEAHILENIFHNGVFLDSVTYSLLKKNFKK
jgi:[ribosomal protein S5]-alanine N-acetyltransferase